MKALYNILNLLIILTLFDSCYYAYRPSVSWDQSTLPYEVNEIFSNNDSSFSIEYYERFDKSDSLTLIHGDYFTFEDNEVIKGRSYRENRILHKPSYWKFTKDENGEEWEYPDRCSNKGFIKSYHTPDYFDTTDTRISGDDSIIDRFHWRINKTQDTICTDMLRNIYNQGKLIESWYKYIPDFHYIWEDQLSFGITTYSYPSPEEEIREFFEGNTKERKSIRKYKYTAIYNVAGKLILSTSECISSDTEPTEYRFFYDSNNKWYKTEYSEGNRLMAVTKKVMVAKTIADKNGKSSD